MGLKTDDVQKRLFQIRVRAGDFLHAADGLEFALMNDGHAVADGFDLAQFVRGEENGFALVLSGAG